MLFARLVLILLFAIPLAGCGLLHKYGFGKSRDKKAAPEARESLVGVIEMVNPEHKFVLIRSQARYNFLPGTQLVTYSPSGLKATLQITPERKSSFLAADIVDGYPQRGFPVFSIAGPEIAQPSSPPPAISPQPGGSPTLWMPEENPIPGVPPTIPAPQSYSSPPPLPAYRPSSPAFSTP